MANSDVFVGLQGSGLTTGTRNQLTSVTTLGTGEQLFQMGSDTGGVIGAFLPIPGQTDIIGASNPIDGNANASVLLDNTGAKIGSIRGATRPYYNSSSFDGKAIRVRGQGRFVTSAGSNTLTFKVYAQLKSSGAVTAGAKLIATIAIGGAGLGAVTGNFIFESMALWDSTSGNIMGAEAWGAAAGSYATRAVTASTQAVAAPLSNWMFLASATFGAGAANAITPIEWVAESV